MSAKKLSGVLKTYIAAGKAAPSPPSWTRSWASKYLSFLFLYHGFEGKGF